MLLQASHTYRSTSLTVQTFLGKQEGVCMCYLLRQWSDYPRQAPLIATIVVWLEAQQRSSLCQNKPVMSLSISNMSVVSLIWLSLSVINYKMSCRCVESPHGGHWTKTTLPPENEKNKFHPSPVRKEHHKTSLPTKRNDTHAAAHVRLAHL